MGIMVIHHGSIMWRDPYLLAFSPNLTSSQRHGKCHLMWYAMEAYHVAYQIHTIMHLDPQHTHAMCFNIASSHYPKKHMLDWLYIASSHKLDMYQKLRTTNAY